MFCLLQVFKKSDSLLISLQAYLYICLNSSLHAVCMFALVLPKFNVDQTDIFTSLQSVHMCTYLYVNKCYHEGKYQHI